MGYYVKIDHGDGLQTLYAHMKAGSLLVSPGQVASQGQQIGTMGQQVIPQVFIYILKFIKIIRELILRHT